MIPAYPILHQFVLNNSPDATPGESYRVHTVRISQPGAVTAVVTAAWTAAELSKAPGGGSFPERMDCFRPPSFRRTQQKRRHFPHR